MLPCIILIFSLLLRDGNGVEEVKQNFRLPTTVYPIHYNLFLTPFLEDFEEKETFTADGLMDVTIEVSQMTKTIVLASNVTVNSSSVKVEDLETGVMLELENVTTGEFDFLIIQLTTDLLSGNSYKVSMEFITKLPEDRLNGFYLDSYFDFHLMKKRYLATTLFSPYHARKAFPCFDEPNFRATFNIRLGRKENYRSTSNMNLLSTIPMEGRQGWFIDEYNTTVRMSSYIVAFMVHDFSFHEAPHWALKGRPVRVYGRRELIEKGGGIYGANLTASVISYFEQTFQIPFPLMKLDSLAVPKFFFNAMENWGAITYKEPIIIYIPGETSESERYRINYVVSHELAHQWFGNLVNIGWWENVWLKEGFATFFGHSGVAHSDPGLDPWLQFTNTLQVAMEFDQGHESHPLHHNPENYAAVADIFTRIPYEKGGSILRMVSSFLTDVIFYRGINKYLSNRMYNGSTMGDLYSAFQEALDESPGQCMSHGPVKEILDPWTLQSGVPLVNVSYIGENTFRFSQVKFGYPDDETVWPIPITFTIGSDEGDDCPNFWLKSASSVIQIQFNSSPLLLVNPTTVGYYRVLYEGNLFTKIIKTLEENHEMIKPAARSQIVDDYFKAAFKSLVNIEEALDLTKYLDKETNFVVWKSALNNLKKIYDFFYNDKEEFGAFRYYFEKKLASSLTLIGLEEKSGESSLVRLLRPLLIQWSCRLGVPTCNNYVSELITTLVMNPKKNEIPADVRLEVYCAGVEFGSSRILEFFINRYKDEMSRVEQGRILRAIASSKTKSDLVKLLDIAIDEEWGLEKEDRILAIQLVAGNPEAKSLLFTFLRENLKEIIEKKYGTAGGIATAISNVGNFLNTREDLGQLEKFVEDYSELLNSSRKSLNSTLLKVGENVEMREGDLPARINNWFQIQNQKPRENSEKKITLSFSVQFVICLLFPTINYLNDV